MWWVILAILVVVLWLLLKWKPRKRSGGTARRYVTRGGVSREVDEVFEASGSGDLPRMLRALDESTHPVDRHYLLLNVVRESYKRRKQSEDMRRLCERIAWLHLSEFPQLAKALIAEDKAYGGEGVLPLVPTFQQLATLLTEKGQFDTAVEVCKKAMQFGLSDGTQGGFEGRIQRIRRKQARS